MFKERQRRAARLQGFLDALEFGARGWGWMPEHVEVAYGQGFRQGKRAVERIIAEARKER